MFLRQSTSQLIRFGPFLDSTDGVTPETALTITQADMQLSKDGAAFIQKNAAGNATHDKDGWYWTTFNAADTNTIGEFYLQVNVAGALPVWVRWWIIEEVIYNALYGSGAAGFDANQRVDVAQIEGVDATDQIRDSILNDATRFPGANVDTPLSNIETDTQNIQTRLPAALVGGRIDSDIGAMQADTITAAAIAASAAQEIADTILQRDIDQVEAGAAIHSLCTAILKAVARIRDNAGTMEIFRTDGVTVHASQAITTDAALQPIDELGTSA